MEDTATQHEPNNLPLPGLSERRGTRRSASRQGMAREAYLRDRCHGQLPVDSSPSRVFGKSVNRGYVALAEYLLSRGASVNHGDASVLHCAVARHCISHPTDMVGLLLRAGADVDARDDEGDSPIAWAMDEMRSDRSERELTRALECVVQLLRHGASLADGHFGFKNDEEGLIP